MVGQRDEAPLVPPYILPSLKKAWPCICDNGSGEVGHSSEAIDKGWKDEEHSSPLISTDLTEKESFF